MRRYKTTWLCGACGFQIEKEGVFTHKGNNLFFERLLRCSCGNSKNISLEDIEIITNHTKTRVMINDKYYIKELIKINHYVKC